MKWFSVPATIGFQGADKGSSSWTGHNFLIIAVDKELFSGFNLKNSAVRARVTFIPELDFSGTPAFF